MLSRSSEPSMDADVGNWDGRSLGFVLNLRGSPTPAGLCRSFIGGIILLPN